MMNTEIIATPRHLDAQLTPDEKSVALACTILVAAVARQAQHERFEQALEIVLGGLSSNAERKRLVMSLKSLGVLTHEQTAMAFYAYPLKGA